MFFRVFRSSIFHSTLILVSALFCAACRKHDTQASTKDSLEAVRWLDSIEHADDSSYRLDTFALGERVVYSISGTKDYHRANCPSFDSLPDSAMSLRRETTISGARYHGLVECPICKPDSIDRDNDDHWKVDEGTDEDNSDDSHDNNDDYY
jgi:hypothetical protein